MQAHLKIISFQGHTYRVASGHVVPTQRDVVFYKGLFGKLKNNLEE
jgi:hypothetical protein